MRRFTKIAAVCVLGSAIAFLGPAAAAIAQGPSSPASCMGQEAAAVSPPGSEPVEAPLGMREFTPFFKQAFPGVPPGASYSFIASLHAGSHEACDEALGE